MTLTQLQPYSGRWVALAADGRVAGAGDTGPAAVRAARKAHEGGSFEVRYVPDLTGEPLTLSPLLTEVEPVLATIDQPLYLVGGAVRDAVLGTASHDLDFAVPAKGIKTAFKVGNALHQPAYPLDKKRDSGRVMVADQKTYLDFVTFRGPDLEADLYDRDVTINAMALPALARSTAELIDPFGGRADLASGTIRQVHQNSLTNDPVRALRAIRMAAQHGFQIEPSTQGAARQALQMLNRPSVERVRDELINLLRHQPEVGLPLLHKLGGLATILPEVARLEGVSQSAPHVYPALDHTWAVVAAVPTAVGFWQSESRWAAELTAHLERDVSGAVTGRDLLILGAIFHDVGKSETQKIDEDGRIRFFNHDGRGAEFAADRLAALRFSRAAVSHVKNTVAGHMRPLLLANEQETTTRAIHRLFKQVGSAGLDIGLLALADHIGTVGAEASRTGPGWDALKTVVSIMFDHYFTHVAPREDRPVLIDGGQLIRELGVEPGPQIGRLLEEIEEAQVEGKIKTPAEALALAKKLVQG